MCKFLQMQLNCQDSITVSLLADLWALCSFVDLLLGTQVMWLQRTAAVILEWAREAFVSVNSEIILMSSELSYGRTLVEL